MQLTRTKRYLGRDEASCIRDVFVVYVVGQCVPLEGVPNRMTLHFAFACSAVTVKLILGSHAREHPADPLPASNRLHTFAICPEQINLLEPTVMEYREHHRNLREAGVLKAQSAAEAEAAREPVELLWAGGEWAALLPVRSSGIVVIALTLTSVHSQQPTIPESIFSKPKLPASGLTARKPSAQAKATPEGGGGALDKEPRAPPPFLELRVLLRGEFFGFFSGP